MTDYVVPATVDEARTLLARDGRRWHFLGDEPGDGLQMVNRPIMDLRGLGLSEIKVTEHTVTIGVMTSLRSVIGAEWLPAGLRRLLERQFTELQVNALYTGSLLRMPSERSLVSAALVAMHAHVCLNSPDTRITYSDWLALPDKEHQLPLAVGFDLPISIDSEIVADAPYALPRASVVGGSYQDLIRLAIMSEPEKGIISYEIKSTAEFDDNAHSHNNNLQLLDEHYQTILPILAERVIGRLKNGGVQ